MANDLNKELVNQQYIDYLEDQIKVFKNQEHKLNLKIQNIQKRSGLFWKYINRYDPFQYSDYIDYCVDSVTVSLFSLKIKGWVIGKDGRAANIRVKNIFSSIKRLPREDVLMMNDIEDDFGSGFEIKLFPFFTTASVQFEIDDSFNEFNISGIKTFIRSIR